MRNDALTPLQRIWRQLDMTSPSGCWIWTGIVNSWGYGAFNVDGKRMVGVHRWLYQQFLGRKLGRWEFCLHKCDTPRCVNPGHLYVGTTKNNSDDMYARGRDRSRGERNVTSKLTDKDVLAIRRDFRRLGYRKTNLKELRPRFPGLSDTAILYAADGRTWTHLPMPDGRTPPGRPRKVQIAPSSTA